MGGVNHQLTNQHATLSASQSLTFSLGGAVPGASVAMQTVPLSRSQQVCFHSEIQKNDFINLFVITQPACLVSN